MESPPRLRVRIFSARNLPKEKRVKKNETSGSSAATAAGRNTFVIIQYGKQKFRTMTASNTLQPVWNEECEFYMKEKYTSIKLSVAEKDLLRDELIGSRLIDLNDLEGKLTTGKFWINLTKRPSGGTTKVPIEAELSIQLDLIGEGSMMKKPSSSVSSKHGSISSIQEDIMPSPAKSFGSKSHLTPHTVLPTTKDPKTLLSETSHSTSSLRERSPSVISGLDSSKSCLSSLPGDERATAATLTNSMSPVRIRRRPSLVLPFQMHLDHPSKSSSFSSLTSLSSFPSTITSIESKFIPEVKDISPKELRLPEVDYSSETVHLEIHGAHLGENCKDLISILIGDVECISYMENWSNHRVVCLIPSSLFPVGEHDVIMTTKTGGVGLSLKKILVSTASEFSLNKLMSIRKNDRLPSTMTGAAGETMVNQEESQEDVLDEQKFPPSTFNRMRHDSNVYLRAEILRLQRLLEEANRENESLRDYIDLLLSKVIERMPSILEKI